MNKIRSKTDAKLWTTKIVCLILPWSKSWCSTFCNFTDNKQGVFFPKQTVTLIDFSLQVRLTGKYHKKMLLWSKWYLCHIFRFHTCRLFCRFCEDQAIKKAGIDSPKSGWTDPAAGFSSFSSPSITSSARLPPILSDSAKDKHTHETSDRQI